MSRCLIVKFPALSEEAVEQHLRSITKKERIKVDDAAFKAIVHESSGDLRRALNLLQVSAAGVSAVTEDTVHECSETTIGTAVRSMVSLAMKGSFAESRDLMKQLIAVEGYSPEEVCLQIQREIVKRSFNPETRHLLMQRIAEIEFRMKQGKNSFIHLSALLASVGDIFSERSA